MTSTEYKTWMRYHNGLFPGLSAWFASMDETKRKAQLEAWHKMLAHLPSDLLRRASDKLYSDDRIDGIAYVNHVKLLKGLVRDSAPPSENQRAIADEQTKAHEMNRRRVLAVDRQCEEGWDQLSRAEQNAFVAENLEPFEAEIFAMNRRNSLVLELIVSRLGE